MNKNKKKESKDKSTGEMSSTSQTGQCNANDTTPKVSASGKSRKVKSVENKHSKHLCKKCHISFATSCILSKHIKNFHDFSRVSSDDEEDDGEIQVIHNDYEALATVEKFRTEINKNICNICNLKFLNGNMLCRHNQCPSFK